MHIFTSHRNVNKLNILNHNQSRSIMKKYTGITFGKFMKNYREDIGITAKMVADGLGVSTSYITKIEKHDEIPAPDVIRKIAKIIRQDEERMLNIAFKQKIVICAQELNERYGREGIEFDKLMDFIDGIIVHRE